MSKRSTELLPCPFCGGAPDISHYGTGNAERCEIGCVNLSGCLLTARVELRSRDEAITAWNTRTPNESAIRADERKRVVEECAKVCEDIQADYVEGAVNMRKLGNIKAQHEKLSLASIAGECAEEIRKLEGGGE